ncbi:MAG: ATP phosphoribosyltransferase [Firmicutes bacterium HGW-Firmicutes-12]|jgi:ATP phosphoribosyltransferase|nr:MAG: ATP phosphoribosyltransferase [Firmicutes bacterium HGW-Firmicutes-12]
MENKLTIALPKGKLFQPTVDLLSNCGMNTQELSDKARTLVFEDVQNKVQFIVCRPTDIPIYVEHGAADLGIVGKDSIIEAGKNLYELLDLKFGQCSFVLAAPRKQLSSEGEYPWKQGLRIATKFPTLAKDYLQKKGLQAEIIKLHGNVELAPRVGLAELIVDLVSTGKTLLENDLVPLEEIVHASARLIVNRASYRLKAERINKLLFEIKVNLKNEPKQD